jgi:hypothetical protein
VADIKLGVERLAGLQRKKQQLYALDGEDVLPDNMILSEPCTLALCVLDTDVSWAKAGDLIDISGNGLVATRREGDMFQYKLVTASEVAESAGVYYWEVALVSYKGGMYIGVARPSLNHDEDHVVGGVGGYTDDGYTDDGYTLAYFIRAADGALFGGGKDGADPSGRLAPGDRVGVCLAITRLSETTSKLLLRESERAADANPHMCSLTFYLNGSIHGPGIQWRSAKRPEPLALAVQLIDERDSVALIPDVRWSCFDERAVEVGLD